MTIQKYLRNKWTLRKMKLENPTQRTNKQHHNHQNSLKSKHFFRHIPAYRICLNGVSYPKFWNKNTFECEAWASMLRKWECVTYTDGYVYYRNPYLCVRLGLSMKTTKFYCKLWVRGLSMKTTYIGKVCWVCYTVHCVQKCRYAIEQTESDGDVLGQNVWVLYKGCNRSFSSSSFHNRRLLSMMVFCRKI